MCKKAEDSISAKENTVSSSGKSVSTSIMGNEKDTSEIYSWVEPAKTEPPLQMKDHFSSLLFGGSIANTLLEHALLIGPVIALYCVPEHIINVPGSMPFQELVTFFWVSAIVRRVYNAYLEAVYFTFPQYRIQPPKEHKLKKAQKDLCGRDVEQLKLLNFHDKLTMISQFALNVGMYYALPGFYPAHQQEEDLQQSFQERFVRLLLNHYIMSFGMYWAHRSLHVVPYLWDHIHSIHHYAKHPLSRNTYEDHWADNFGNAIVGHLFAQILVPLDRPTFWFSRLFRILESLEKHSGVSCGYNLAYSAQQWLPFAQMPHHHDWHHEGFKGSNYTFSSIGGLWDCVFGTRKSGRYTSNNNYGATKRDMAKVNEKKELPEWFSPLYPLVGLSIAVAFKLL
eukprot:CAMPEP_0195293640 /NCGR_PEP_ID=MMETSP0707-20130614/12965_1 /TAXON_ID=33640 /ORGANISM="Asterionellopsis glacialis, Strain CCMP134" /LENGTH=394 /DNA_ID=CAMNT_0040354399 /DNA_START=157 /DNA_END=1341 /DNA_ORIENTATION=+